MGFQNKKDYPDKISIFGLGYVGLPLAVKIANLNSNTYVLGIEVDQNKIDMLKKGISYIDDVADEDLSNIIEKNFYVRNDATSIAKETEISIICVPTPVNDKGVPILDHIFDVLKEIAESILKLEPKKDEPHHIILESTTYPTTTENVAKEFMLNYGLKNNKDFTLSFSPERVDPGNMKYEFTEIPKIIGPENLKLAHMMKQFYKNIAGIDTVTASSPRTAEMTKLFENIFRQVNIALVNELALICEKMDIDVFEVIDLAKTKPFGFLPHYPGPGLGGHCIPVDPYYLAYIAKEYEFETRFINLANTINDNMIHHTIDLVITSLNRVDKPIKNSDILIIGYAYKKDISDIRNSPAIPISSELKNLGANIMIHDDLVRDKVNLNFEFVDLKRVKTADLVLIITPHSNVNFEYIIKNVSDKTPLIDTRGVISLRNLRKIDFALGRKNK